MVFPRTEKIYEFNGTEYIVHAVNLFNSVITQNILKSNNIHDGSHFYIFNWWKFMWNAKFIKSNKLNDAY